MKTVISSKEPLLCSTRQGVPIGLLMHYILHKLASKPAYGYEILKDITHKTQGKWQPSPGSLYPLFKKMLEKGFIEVKEVEARRKIRRLYTITPKGLHHLRTAKSLFINGSQRLAASRNLLIDMLDTEDIPKFIAEGSKLHFNILHAIIDKNTQKLNPEITQKILTEYAKHLEDEIKWVKQKIQTLKNKEDVKLCHLK
ncbi:MAG: PadR family transcriptional regulator [Nitrososphaerales archaeon]